MIESAIARLYVKSQSAERVVLNIPGTSYEIALRPAGEITPSPQGRIRGVIRLPVWKLDEVTAGGAFVEPVYGRPRRVQGTVSAVIPATNSVVVDVCGQPIVGDLPARWNAGELAIGSRVGLDIPKGGVFEPLKGEGAGELGHTVADPVNLRVA